MSSDNIVTNVIFRILPIISVIYCDCDVTPALFTRRNASAAGHGCAVLQGVTWPRCSLHCFTTQSCSVVTYFCASTGCVCLYCKSLGRIYVQDTDVYALGLQEKLIAQDVAYPPQQYVSMANGFQEYQIIRLIVKLGQSGIQIIFARDPPNGDLPLILDIKLSEKRILYNGYLDGTWGDIQVYDEKFPFVEGQEVEILLLGLQLEIQVYFDLEYYFHHAHKTTLSNINAIGVEGTLLRVYVKE